MVERRKRRKWSDDERCMICAQTVVPGVSVAQVARRYDLNANKIFNWLKDPKFCYRFIAWQTDKGVLGMYERQTVKKYRIYLTLFVVLLAYFLVAIYPRPFKRADLSYLSTPLLQTSNPDFSYVGFWYGCQIEVHSHAGDTAPPLGSLTPNLESKFSPWISSLEGVFYQDAYFYTLNFDECYTALNERYPGTNMSEQLFGGVPGTELRVGGMAEFSEPLSHANSLIIFTTIDQQRKLILVRGGD